MNLQMGSHTFHDVTIPILWGERAVLRTSGGRLSIIDLAGPQARLEILADEPAPGVEFRPRVDGTVILRDGVELYSFDPRHKILTPIALRLPECELSDRELRVGASTFSGATVSGYGVGLLVTADSVGMGAPLPPGLAKLEI